MYIARRIDLVFLRKYRRDHAKLEAAGRTSASFPLSTRMTNKISLNHDQDPSRSPVRDDVIGM